MDISAVRVAFSRSSAVWGAPWRQASITRSRPRTRTSASAAKVGTRREGVISFTPASQFRRFRLHDPPDFFYRFQAHQQFVATAISQVLFQLFPEVMLSNELEKPMKLFHRYFNQLVDTQSFVSHVDSSQNIVIHFALLPNRSDDRTVTQLTFSLTASFGCYAPLALLAKQRNDENLSGVCGELRRFLFPSSNDKRPHNLWMFAISYL